MTNPAPHEWGYRPALDGVRTVAIYLVVLFHSGLVHAANGFIGVDVFFVLSGFLVTNVMAKEWDRTGSIRLRRFYARRVRRLLPAAVALVVSIVGLTTLVQPRLTRISFIGDAESSLLYIANWHFLGASTDYFAADVNRSPFLHFWSLAIEEQFYIVFPVLLLGLLALSKRTRRPALVPFGLAAIMATSIVTQFVMARSNPLRAYYGTDARLYQLLAGATLAMSWHRLGSGHTSWTRPVSLGRGRLANVVVGGGVVLLVALGSDVVHMSVSNRGVLAVVITVAVVAALELAPDAFAGRTLSRPAMTYLGRISYGTYLWHWPLIVLARVVFDLSALQMAALVGVGATAMSAISFQLLETPIRRSPRLDGHPRAVVAVGLSCSLVAALFVVPPILRSNRHPAIESIGSGRNVDVGPAGTRISADGMSLADVLADVPPTNLDVASTEPPPYDEASCRVENPDTCILHRGSGMHLHLIGDSNAMILVPLFLALAKRHDYTLSVSARVGCPWQQGLVWGAQDTSLVSRCVAARQDWYDRTIPALHPDVIVAVHVPRDVGSRKDAFFQAEQSADHRPIADVVATATEASLDRLTALGARVVLFEPLPYDTIDPTQCLSGAATVADCSYQANSTPFPTELLYRDEDVRRPEVFTVDPDFLACPFLPVCVPMIGGELVFRNQFHLSNKWLLDHADRWWDLIMASGALDGLAVS